MKTRMFNHSAFTLAEMMVVMLIMSIVMAAMAPVMTTRMKSQSAEDARPWQWTADRVDAFLNSIPNGRAIIGRNTAGDENSRLVISTNANRPNHIGFQEGNDSIGYLRLRSTGTIELGNNITTNGAAHAIAIGTTDGANGHEIEATGTRSIAIGIGSKAIGLDSIATNLGSQAHGKYSVSLGAGSTAGHFDDIPTDEIHAIAIGGFARAGEANTPAIENPIAVGYLSQASNNSAISIGNSSGASGVDSIAISTSATASNTSAIAMGNRAEASGEISIAIGGTNNDTQATKASNTQSIAIGFGSDSNGWASIAIGGRTISGAHSVAMGSGAKAYNTDSLSIGHLSIAGNKDESSDTATNAIAIGTEAKAPNQYAIAMGDHAEAYIRAVAIGTSAKAKGEQSMAFGYRANAVGEYSLAIGESTTTTGASHAIAIGPANFGSGVVEQTVANGTGAIAIGSRTTAGVHAIAIGTHAKAKAGNIAIGTHACSGVEGSNKICIGVNSGPESWHNWAKADDGDERIFIGSKSKFNDGVAVLEVHNVEGQTKKFVKDGDSSFNRTLNKTSVVINGNLIVKGGIITSLPWSNNQKWSHNGNVNLLGRSGGQIEPIDLDGSKLKDAFGLESMGTFASPDRGSSSGTNDLLLSDRRLKYVGTESKAGLDKIRQLKVFNYTFKKDENKTPHVGVIAQDLQKVFPDAVTKGDDGFLRIRLEDMFYAIINAIKELDTKVTQLLKQESAKDKRIKKLEDQNKALEARLRAIEAKIK